MKGRGRRTEWICGKKRTDGGRKWRRDRTCERGSEEKNKGEGKMDREEHRKLEVDMHT